MSTLEVSTLEASTTPPVRPRPQVGWTELAVAVLGYVALSVAVSVALGATVRSPDVALAVAAVGVATLGAVGLALVVRVRSLAPLRLRLPARRWLLVGLGAGVGMRVVVVGVALVWMHLTGDTTNPQQVFADGAASGGWTLVGLVVFGGLAVPFAEELFFRGVVYSALRRYGPVLAALGSAASFGIAHGVSMVLVVAFLLGLVNAALVERSGSIWPPVLAHATNNTIAFGLAYLLAWALRACAVQLFHLDMLRTPPAPHRPRGTPRAGCPRRGDRPAPRAGAGRGRRRAAPPPRARRPPGRAPARCAGWRGDRCRARPARG
jgi:CAAX protease family protein